MYQHNRLSNNNFSFFQKFKNFDYILLTCILCLGFISLATDEPNSHVITDGILDLVQKTPFSLKIDKILKLESLEEKSCKIILKSDGKLMAFKINLEESSFYPFNYKLNQLDQLANGDK